jgi:uncharacterized protein with WD repeat
LCVKITRKKTKTQVTQQFEIFRVKQARGKGGAKKGSQVDIPVDIVMLDNDRIDAFMWEPNGHRFAIVHQAPPSSIGNVSPKPSVSVYRVEKKEVKLVGRVTDKNVNRLYWSPVCGILVLAAVYDKDDSNPSATVNTASGSLEWIDTNVTPLLTLSQKETEHPKCSDVHWDPSGRYVISTAVKGVLDKEPVYFDLGYKVWSMHGKLLYTETLPVCYQVLWRPRPQSNLPMERRKQIMQELEAGKAQEDKRQKIVQDKTLSAKEKQSLLLALDSAHEDKRMKVLQDKTLSQKERDSQLLALDTLPKGDLWKALKAEDEANKLSRLSSNTRRMFELDKEWKLYRDQKRRQLHLIQSKMPAPKTTYVVEVIETEIPSLRQEEIVRQ